jgi:hypothetical protein
MNIWIFSSVQQAFCNELYALKTAKIPRLENMFKLSVYHPGVFTKLNKMVFNRQTHLFIIVLIVLFGRHVSTLY